MDYQQREQLRQVLQELERIHTDESAQSTMFSDLAAKASAAGDHASAEALRSMAAHRMNNYGEIDFMINDMKEKLQEPKSDEELGIVYRQVFFDQHGYALGAILGPHSYGGDYASAEWMEVPDDFYLPEATISQIQEAVRHRRED